MGLTQSAHCNNERVLAYISANQVTKEELEQVGGGSNKWSCQTTHRATGRYPGAADWTEDQVWD